MNPERFKAEVVPLREKLFHIALRMLEEPQDAEDAVQEAFLKLWHIRDSLDGYDSVAAFATTVTKNICVDKHRIRGKETSLDEAIYRQAATDSPYLQLERKNSDELIRWIIAKLPPLQQEIIRMKDIEEYEVEQIAEITGTRVEAVRMNLSRARKKVREDYLKWTS